MKVNRLMFAMAKRYLNHTGKAVLARKPDFADYEKYLDVAPKQDALDNHCYDIILAKKENRQNIALLNIHGGAYVYATRRHNHEFMKYFLERGFDIVVLDYPLGNGKINTLDQFKAIYEEVAHFAAHRKEYGLEEKAFVTGDSAGGHFALLLAEVLSNDSLRESLGFEKVDLELSGALLNCPVYDFEASVTGPLMTNGVRKQMWGSIYKDAPLRRLLDPRVHYPSYDKPLFLSSCKHDFIGTNSKALAEDAKQYGKDLEYLYFDTDKKGVDHVHNIVRMDLEESIAVNDGMIAFMEKH